MMFNKRVSKELLFINGAPALFLRRERALVVGDLHIGVEFKLGEQGLHFPNASKSLGVRISKLCRENDARILVLLGDVKESISYPAWEEYNAIRDFFEPIKDVEIRMVRGNHDARLDKVLQNFGYSFDTCRELLFDDVALLHGNSWPSECAMKKDCIITGHGHLALVHDNRVEKVWLIAKTGKEIGRYRDHNKNVKLIVVPAFSDLITGGGIGRSTKSNIPLLKNGVFDWGSAGVYSLSGDLIGHVSELSMTRSD